MFNLINRILSMLPVALPVALNAAQTPKTAEKPNILIIMVDDMGYSDIGCFGSEIKTPNIDKLANNGMRFSNYYNCAKSYPSRASLLTGLYFQRTDREFPNTATLGEVLKPEGYITLWSGKHHAKFNPVTRGFDHFYGLLGGAENHFNPGSKAISGQPQPAGDGKGVAWSLDPGEVNDFVPENPDFYDTDAFTERAMKWLQDYQSDKRPFMLYMAYTAPHWPLMAHPEDIAKYKGVYDVGYEAIRQARYDRQIKLGLIDPKTTPLPPMEFGTKKAKLSWTEMTEEDRKIESAKMETYAAMIDRVDQNIGRILKLLKSQGKLENTLVLFMSDNGASTESPKVNNVDTNAPQGSVSSFTSYGQSWATVSDTPLRKWKGESFEGGISTPLVAFWPNGIKPQNQYYREPVHLIDIMPTVIEITGAKYPGISKELNIAPVDGVSLLPAFKGQMIHRTKPLFFQFGKGSAIRDGQWKLVRSGESWELYNITIDRNEMQNVADMNPERVNSMSNEWLNWWKNCTGSEWNNSLIKGEKEN